jgi:hypothetical protein
MTKKLLVKLIRQQEDKELTGFAQKMVEAAQNAETSK